MLAATFVLFIGTIVAVETVIISNVGDIDFWVGVVRGNIVLTFGGASDGKIAYSSTLLSGAICSIANPKI